MNKVNIWAKSSKKEKGPIPLLEHTKDALMAFDEIKHRAPSHLCDFVRLAIICHDWGKVLPAFQIRTVKNRHYKPTSPSINVPHSFFSVLFINENKFRYKVPDRDYREFLFSAIAYHHWRENFFGFISTYNDEIAELCEALERKGKINELEQNLREEIKKLNDGWHEFIEFNIEMAKGLSNGVPFSEYARPPYQLYFLPKRADIDNQKLQDWILIAGFLQRSDHFASFCEVEGEDLFKVEIEPVGFELIKENIKDKIGGKASNVYNTCIWQLAKIKDKKDKNLILIAPTGYGKTEFAFLWGGEHKFFYTLPLRAAVNQIFKRSQDIFGEDKSGILHSDADVFLLGDGGEEQTSLKSYHLAKQLALPAIISTGDQFFPYALRPPGYEKIYATFSYSRLIIDEVQAYDPRAAAIVVKFIEDVVRIGGKFLLMTATLPEFVQKEIEKTIGVGNFEKINLYSEENKKFKAIKKHKIKVELIENSRNNSKIDFSVPEPKLTEILNTANQGKRVLVIVNTVKLAQNIYHLLKEIIEADDNYASLKEKLYLLHSRFTLKDREYLENTLINKEFKNPKPDNESEGKILVATQVVEASLDVDADILFTEIAPIDALVQRMGRVLRRYGPLSKDIPEVDEPNVFVWVFKEGLQSGEHHVYDTELLLLTLILLNNAMAEENKNNRNWFEQFEQIRKKHNKPAEQITAFLKEFFRGRQSFELICSEYDKYELVKELYKKLYDLKDSNYLKEFQQTKDILDAGYMSDRKEEAHGLFRRIYSLPVIPKNQKEAFKDAIKQFFDNTHPDQISYTLFKENVLARFVLQVPWKYEKEIPESVDEWLDIEKDTLIDEDAWKRIIRWCKGIYFSDCDYDPIEGLKRSESKYDTFIF